MVAVARPAIANGAKNGIMTLKASKTAETPKMPVPSFAAKAFDLSLSKPLASSFLSINGMSSALLFLGAGAFSSCCSSV